MQNRHHEQLVELAREAIDSVQADLSVHVSETIASLRDIREHLDMIIDALLVEVNDD